MRRFFSKLEDGESDEPLWISLSSNVNGFTLPFFLDGIVSFTSKKLLIKNHNMVSETLDLYTFIFKKIMNTKSANKFQNFFKQIYHIYEHVNNTVLSEPDFFIYRKKIFLIAGMAWGNNDSTFILKLYKTIQESLHNKE